MLGNLVGNYSRKCQMEKVYCLSIPPDSFYRPDWQGMVDSKGYQAIMETALETQEAVEAQQWEQATNSWSALEQVVEIETFSADFYNILSRIPGDDGKRLRKPSSVVG